MTRLAGGVVIALLIGATTAHASRAAGDRCALSLPLQSRAIYDRAVSAVVAGQTIEDTLTAIVRPMVFSGALSIFSARSSAEAAAKCLDLARQ